MVVAVQLFIEEIKNVNAKRTASPRIDDQIFIDQVCIGKEWINS